MYGKAKELFISNSNLLITLSNYTYLNKKDYTFFSNSILLTRYLPSLQFICKYTASYLYLFTRCKIPLDLRFLWAGSSLGTQPGMWWFHWKLIWRPVSGPLWGGSGTCYFIFPTIDVTLTQTLSWRNLDFPWLSAQLSYVVDKAVPLPLTALINLPPEVPVLWQLAISFHI